VKIAIIGGGIGGLTTALMLHRAGFRPTVYESVADIRALGVGINVLPHAVRVLSDLGLQNELGEYGIKTRELLYFNKLGQRIWQEDRGLDAGYPWPQFSILRGAVQYLLLEAATVRLGAERIKTGHHLVDVTQDGAKVALSFATSRDASVSIQDDADIVIGADGIHSAVRRGFYPDEGPPIWNGAILWRGVTESEPFLTGRSLFMAGHAKQKFVCYPVSQDHLKRGRSLTNWVAELRVDPAHGYRREDWNRHADLKDFLPAFRSWRFDWIDIPGLISAAQEVFEYPMVDRDPVERWSFDRVTLLGDAAHPMYPIGSNGASQAILDAEAVAKALATTDDPIAALRRYEDERLGPTSAIVRANRQNGPDEVMQIVEERAPDGFDDLNDVISQRELEDIAQRYKQLAGFDRERLISAATGDEKTT
jgi:5-methylphenazine-1-carboxylate 1-monooxygenase